MYCKHCGGFIQLPADHCSKCGISVSALPDPRARFEEEDTAASNRSRWWKHWLRQVSVGALIVGFGVLIWLLTYWLRDVKMLQGKTLERGDDILSIVFNISSSTLTLVGLVTIFVSINGQHRIQRCREILWELMELPYQCWNDRGKFEYKFTLEQGIRQRFLAYKEVLYSGRTFNYVIVMFAFVIIIIVSSMITATVTGMGSAYFTNMNEATFIKHTVRLGVVMMLAFGLLILSLSRISLIASLPSLHNLIDTNATKTGLSSILFAAITMRVIPTNPLVIRFAFPFRNLQICPWIVATLRETGEEVQLIGGPFETDPNKTPLKLSHIDYDRAHRLQYLVLPEFDVTRYSKVRYQFELQSKQGTVYVRFEHDAGESENGALNQDWIHPLGIGPKLAVESQLFEDVLPR